jgi:hypothetical protein
MYRWLLGNNKTEALMEKEKHLGLCDAEATNLQYEIIKQLPSMNQRIHDVISIHVCKLHPRFTNGKINFVSEELASQGFTPSVFH